MSEQHRDREQDRDHDHAHSLKRILDEFYR